MRKPDPDQLDLFDRPMCGGCADLDDQGLDSGICYCWGWGSWKFPTNPACDIYSETHATQSVLRNRPLRQTFATPRGRGWK